MSNFEINGEFELNDDNVTVASAAELLKVSLLKNYNHWKFQDKTSLEKVRKRVFRGIRVTPTGLVMHSTFKTLWDKGGLTDANVKFVINDKVLSYSVTGGWGFNWHLSTLYFGLGLLLGFPLLLLLLNIITYVTSRDRPKKYFVEAFQTLQFELGTENAAKASKDAIANVSINEKLKELQTLFKDSLISESDYNLKKQQLLDKL